MNLIYLIGFFIFLINIIIASQGKLNLKKWSFVMIAFFYGFIYILVFKFSLMGFNDIENIRSFSQYGIEGHFLYFICVLFMSLGFIIAFNSKNKIDRLYPFDRSFFYLNNDKLWGDLYKYSIYVLIFSFITYYLYALAYGGFGGLLAYTMIIRRGAMEVANQWSFLQKFGSLSYISGFCLFAVMKNKNVNKTLRRKAKFWWLIALLFSLFVAFSQGGRGVILNLILIYMFTLIFAHSNSISGIIFKHWPKIALGILGFLIMSIFWRDSGDSDPKFFIAQGYTYLFNSFIASVNAPEFLYFQEIVYSPLFLLPQSLYMGKFFKTTNMMNTYYIQGGYKGDVINGVYIAGENTTGLLSFSYYQLGIIGVLVVSIIVGLLINRWNDRIKKMPNTPFRNMLYAYYFIQVVYYFVSSGTFYNFVITNFGYIVFFFAFPYYRKFFAK